MLIGTFHTGTIEHFNGQVIKTKFFILGIPLFPISSFYFVTNDKGIELPLVGKSVRLGFGKTLCTAIGLALTIVYFNYDNYPNNVVRILTIVGACVFLPIAIYSWLFQKSVPLKEQKSRLILEKEIGYNMLPSKLPKQTRRKLLKVVASKVIEKYNITEVSQIFGREHFENSELPLLYCFALYIDAVNPHEITTMFLLKYQVDTIQ